MPRTLGLIAILLLAGCDQVPGDCDYCGKHRGDVKRYVCLTCQKSHACCDAEKNILKSEDGVDRHGFHYNTNTCIAVCPTELKPEIEVREVFVQRSRQAEIFLDIVCAAAIAVIMYCKGRVDGKRRVGGKSC